MAETDPDTEGTVRYFKCLECGAEDLDVSSCVRCGHPSPSNQEGNEDTIRVSLTFAAATCPNCERLSPAPTCLRCGASVPEPDDPGEAVRARQQAFRPLLEQLQQIKRGFDLPPANIRVAADQYMAAVVDAGLFDAVLRLLAFAKSMSELEFSDRSVIGARTRREIRRYVELLGTVQQKTARLAWFAPPGEAAELRELLIGVGFHGARIAEETLNLLMAASFAQAQEAAGRWQTALSTFTESEQFTVLYSSLLESQLPDLNGRLEVALGIEGDFFDAFGLIDIPKVFSAAARTSRPALDVIAQGAGGFFSHLLETAPEELDASAVALMFAAVPLAIADRPLEGHAVARLTRELAMQAHARAADDSRALISGIEEDGATVFAASLRIHRELRLLATGQVEGIEDVVISLVKNYKTLAESAFRAYAQATVDLRAIRDGRPPFGDSPLLGTLSSRLIAARDELGELLVAAVDTRLRNAEAHEDYGVRADGSITFFSDGTSMGIDDLNRRAETLATAVAGMQAGLVCFGVDLQLFGSAPAWIVRGDLPAAQRLVARSVLAMFGADVRDLTFGLTVEVALMAPPPAPLSPLTYLVSLIPVVDEVAEFRVYGPGDELILICPAEPLRAFAEATDDVRDLAVIAPTYAAAVATGADANSAFVDALAAMLMMVAAAIAADIDTLAPATVFDRAERRLAYAQQFAVEYRPANGRSTGSVLSAVAAARQASKPAARGNTMALRRLASQLGHIEKWVAGQRVQWPPDWLES